MENVLDSVFSFSSPSSDFRQENDSLPPPSKKWGMEQEEGGEGLGETDKHKEEEEKYKTFATKKKEKIKM